MLPSIASLAVQIGNRQEQPDAVHQTCGARRMESGNFIWRLLRYGFLWKALGMLRPPLADLFGEHDRVTS